MTSVDVRSLTAGYGGDVVLADLDLSVPSGEVAAVLGPSGSGKTTLLRVLAGFLKPTAGTVNVGGAELSSMSNSQLSHWRSTNVGFIFQSFQLIPYLTAKENVKIPLSISGVGKKRQEAMAISALARSSSSCVPRGST